ncbi:MAG: transcriptional regulator NrdR, partial [Geopsychrobacter sp.]|nr:transcriptional regulator NrdR [Geopsychrobacter sp.]
MNCPFCSHGDTRVVDSRLGKEGNNVRRRRECPECGRRFTTYERVEEMLPWVIKRMGDGKPLNGAKLSR